MTTYTASSIASPIVINGLPAGNYKFNVSATNAIGTGASSGNSPTYAVTQAVIPTHTYARGVNSAGADFGNRGNLNGTYDSDASFAFYASRGHTMIRIPFLWERMQNSLYAALATGELGRLTAAVNSATSRNMIANIDCHNYARYESANGTTNVIGDGTLTAAHLADLWTKLANQFKSNPLVHFGLMNEPHDLPGANSIWEQGAQQTVTAIRSTGSTNWCWVSGVGYDNAAGFWSNHPNWFITDSRSGAEGHYYFDADASGQYSTSYAAAVQNANNQGYSTLGAKTSADVSRFCSGAQSRGVRCYIGEMGWENTGSDSANWNAAGNSAYAAMDQYNAYGTYWAAGEAWGSTYNLSAYTGTPQSQTTGVSATIEAHPGSEIDP